MPDIDQHDIKPLGFRMRQGIYLPLEIQTSVDGAKDVRQTKNGKKKF